MTKSRNINKARIFWTPEQLVLLREHYPDTRTADLVTTIGRNERAIYAKAAELGIQNPPHSMPVRHPDASCIGFRVNTPNIKIINPKETL